MSATSLTHVGDSWKRQSLIKTFSKQGLDRRKSFTFPAPGGMFRKKIEEKLALLGRVLGEKSVSKFE